MPTWTADRGMQRVRRRFRLKSCQELLWPAFAAAGQIFYQLLGRVEPNIRQLHERQTGDGVRPALCIYRGMQLAIRNAELRGEKHSPSCNSLFLPTNRLRAELINYHAKHDLSVGQGRPS